MVTLQDAVTWSPEAVAAASDALAAKRKQLLDLVDEFEAGAPDDAWTGMTANAARATHADISSALADQISELSRVVAELDIAAQAMGTHGAALTGTLDDIAVNGFSVTPAGTGFVVTAPPDSSSSVLDVLRISAWVSQLEDALSGLTEVDANLQAVLAAARENRIRGGAGDLSEAVLPEELRGLDDEEVVEYLLANPTATSTYLDLLTPRQLDLLGEELADNAEVFSDAAFDVYGGGGVPPSSDDVALTAEQLLAFGEHPGVATTVLERLGPQGLVDAQRTVLSGVAPADGSAYSDEQIAAFQRGLGTVLAGGTQLYGVETADGAPAGPSVDEQWVQDFLAVGEEQGSYVGPDGALPYGYQILAPLLGEPGHGPHFVLEVATAVEEFERANGGSSVWPSHPGTDLDRAYSLDPSHRYDPMEGVMRGLSHSPEAARTFFAVADGDASRLEYHLTERDWFSGQLQANDGQDALGDALVAATVEGIDPSADPPDDRGARILEHSVAIVTDDLRAEGDAAQLNYYLQEDFATMLGAYSGDVFDGIETVAQEGTDGRPVREPGEGTSASLTAQDLRLLIPAVSENPDAAAVLTGSFTAYAASEYDYYLSGQANEDAPQNAYDPGRDPVDQYLTNLGNASTHVSTPYGYALGLVADGSAESAIDTGSAEDAAASARGDSTRSGIGLVVKGVTGFGLGMLPGGGILSPAIGSAVDGVVGGLNSANDVDTSAQVLAQVGDQVLYTEGAAVAVLDNAAYQHMPEELLTQVAEDGTEVNVFATPDGGRLPMDQWGDEQWNRWEQVRGDTDLGDVSPRSAAQDLAQLMRVELR
ncbi:hypothetical protein RDV89_08015 [Nocardioides zeae]|uniref:DUF6571 domain-containing protein n=1 Tax=Nocardioides imazamoxiresistens TaxID=3231893 RepID=A0ABU3PV05_9ACTN|nr:DUF6571 family protein [Nocardioides zeae]MDT9593009.1 hypothetical protein [Nocardioides zeae]